MNDLSKPTQSSQMIHRPLNPTNDPPVPFPPSECPPLRRRVLHSWFSMDSRLQSRTQQREVLPPNRNEWCLDTNSLDRPSMTVPRKFDRFPPSKSLSHTFLKITSLILSADDAIKPPPSPSRFPHAINADFLSVKSSPYQTLSHSQDQSPRSVDASN